MKFFLVVLIGTAVLYTAGVFVFMDSNPHNWSSFGRGVLAFLWVLWVLLASPIIAYLSKEES